MRGLRRSVRIIECSDNRSSDNRGFTVYLLISGQNWASIHLYTVQSYKSIALSDTQYMYFMSKLRNYDVLYLSLVMGRGVETGDVNSACTYCVAGNFLLQNFIFLLAGGSK